MLVCFLTFFSDIFDHFSIEIAVQSNLCLFWRKMDFLSPKWIKVIVLSECSLSALWVLSECSLSALWVFSECSLSVLWVLSECSLSMTWIWHDRTDRQTKIGTSWAPVWAKSIKNMIFFFLKIWYENEKFKPDWCLKLRKMIIEALESFVICPLPSFYFNIEVLSIKLKVSIHSCNNHMESWLSACSIWVPLTK